MKDVFPFILTIFSSLFAMYALYPKPKYDLLSTHSIPIQNFQSRFPKLSIVVINNAFSFSFAIQDLCPDSKRQNPPMPTLAQPLRPWPSRTTDPPTSITLFRPTEPETFHFMPIMLFTGPPSRWRDPDRLWLRNKN